MQIDKLNMLKSSADSKSLKDINVLKNAENINGVDAINGANTQSTNVQNENATINTLTQITDLPIFEPLFFNESQEVNSLIPALLFAFIAGIILNFMPCVLPVVSLKLSSLMRATHLDNTQKEKYFRAHNIFFSLGILCFFALLALLFYSTDLFWGEIFQNTWLVITLAAFLFLFSLSLFEVFSLPIINFGGKEQNGSPKIQAFFSGIFITLLATPCSGPFLGGVLSWALLKAPFAIAPVFLSLGIGMSTPYLLMALFPQSARFLPKAGAWTGYLAKVIAFLLLATSCYFLSFLADEFLLPTLFFFISLAFTAWIYQTAQYQDKKRARGLVVLAASIFIISTFFFVKSLEYNEKVNLWTSFNTEQFITTSSEKNTLIIFTANWCPSCKVLEKTVFNMENMNKWKRKYSLEFIKIDMTHENPQANILLKALHSGSIPLVALFSPQKKEQPFVLRDLFTSSQLEKSMKSYF